MTRLLFMHHISSIGGGSYCLLNIIREIDKGRFEPVVALRSDGPLAGELRKNGVEVVIFSEMAVIPHNRGLLQRSSLNSYWKVHKSIPALKNLLKEKRIDVLYLNNMMLCRYLKAAKECGCKTVIHVREHWPLNEHKRQLGWARRCVYNYADKMIAINHYSASMFPEKDKTIVYDWIDMEGRYKPISMSEIFGEDMSGKKVLLCTSGLSSMKGADYVLDSFVHGIAGDQYRLLVLGVNNIPSLTGWTHIIKTLLGIFGYAYYEKELCKFLKTDSRIKCLPAIYDLSDIIEQSHCFVSYFRMPHANLALAENIILGNPCIVADTEESREYSKNGRYAKLVTPKLSQKEFSVQLMDFLNHIDQWKRAANEGKRDVKEKFSPERNIAMMNAVLDSLL